MLDLVVLIAMAVTAAAFAVGLIIQSGIAQIPALIAAAALYMVMAASYLMVTRSTRSAPVTDRLNELEEALEIIDGDLQRIDRVEDDVARLDLLNDRVERLDQAVADYGSNETVGGLARFDQFASEFEEVHTKIEGLRADLEGEARNQRDKIANDLRALEGVIKQLSRDMAVASAASAAGWEAPAAAPAPSAPIAEPEAKKEALADVPTETLTVFEVEDEGEIVELAELEEDVVPLEQESAAGGAHPRVGDDEMLEIIAHAIEEGRVDLYLQPTVMLPERRPRYYEAFTRIRTKADDLILDRDRNVGKRATQHLADAHVMITPDVRSALRPAPEPFQRPVAGLRWSTQRGGPLRHCRPRRRRDGRRSFAWRGTSGRRGR